MKRMVFDGTEYIEVDDGRPEPEPDRFAGSECMEARRQRSFEVRTGLGASGPLEDAKQVRVRRAVQSELQFASMRRAI